MVQIFFDRPNKKLYVFVACPDLKTIYRSKEDTNRLPGRNQRGELEHQIEENLDLVYNKRPINVQYSTTEGNQINLTLESVDFLLGREFVLFIYSGKGCKAEHNLFESMQRVEEIPPQDIESAYIIQIKEENFEVQGFNKLIERISKNVRDRLRLYNINLEDIYSKIINEATKDFLCMIGLLLDRSVDKKIRAGLLYKIKQIVINRVSFEDLRQRQEHQIEFVDDIDTNPQIAKHIVNKDNEPDAETGKARDSKLIKIFDKIDSELMENQPQMKVFSMVYIFYFFHLKTLNYDINSYRNRCSEIHMLAGNLPEELPGCREIKQKASELSSCINDISEDSIKSKPNDVKNRLGDMLKKVEYMLNKVEKILQSDINDKDIRHIVLKLKSKCEGLLDGGVEATQERLEKLGRFADFNYVAYTIYKRFKDDLSELKSRLKDIVERYYNSGDFPTPQDLLFELDIKGIVESDNDRNAARKAGSNFKKSYAERVERLIN